MILWTSLTLAILASGLSLTADVKKDRIKFMDVESWDAGLKSGEVCCVYIYDVMQCDGMDYAGTL